MVEPGVFLGGGEGINVFDFFALPTHFGYIMAQVVKTPALQPT